VIWMLPWLEANWAFAWREAGNMDAGQVRNGEWWRCVTALTLHADLGHIIGNSAFGAIFGLFVGRYLGSGFGWLLVLISGAVGNGLNAWIQPDEFRSIGASTATFGALGLGASYVWRRGYFKGRGWRRGLTPVFAAIALLAYTGVGGGNTDVVAHFMGFGAGVALGIVAATFDVRRLGVSGQYLAGIAAFGIIIFAWGLAPLAA
jgi:rhomboid protease GluP